MSSELPIRTGTVIVFRKRMLFAIGLLVLVAGALVFPFPMKGRLWGDLFDLAHAPVFCLSLIALVGFLDPVAAGFSARFQTIVPMTIRRVAVITLVLMTTGLVGEFLQKFAGRSPSWGDVFANSAGLLAGLCWIGSRKCPTPFKRPLVATAVGIILAISANPLLEIWDSIERIRSFPALASFERAREIRNWIGHNANAQISNDWSSDGDYSLSVRLHQSQYPGAALIYLGRDWSEFKQLRFDVMNPGKQNLKLIVKIQDQPHSDTGFDYHDRYHQEIEIRAGEQSDVVVDLENVKNAPASRQMDMTQINMIDIFSVDVVSPLAFYVDRVRLSK